MELKRRRRHIIFKNKYFQKSNDIVDIFDDSSDKMKKKVDDSENKTDSNRMDLQK